MLGQRAALALLAMSAFDVLFSIYLIYPEPFVIGAVCAWCLTSAVVMSVETASVNLQAAPARSSRH
jgi:uncharacterized membrane protein